MARSPKTIHEPTGHEEALRVSSCPVQPSASSWITSTLRGNSILLAALLLLVAAGFRTWQLDRVPPGLHHDEVINGQIVQEFIWPALPAWSRPAGSSSFIPWLTLQANPLGPDLQEHAWLFQVTLAGTLSVLGTNLLGVRFAAFAWGMLGVSACYALTRRLFGRHVALIAMAVQAVSFWSVSIGRVGLRVGTILPLLALAGCMFWDAWRSPRQPLARFVLAGVLLGLSVYGYLSARPMVLAFITFAAYLGLTRPPRLESKRLAWGMVVLLISAALVAAPLFLSTRTISARIIRWAGCFRGRAGWRRVNGRARRRRSSTWTRRPICSSQDCSQDLTGL